MVWSLPEISTEGACRVGYQDCWTVFLQAVYAQGVVRDRPAVDKGVAGVRCHCVFVFGTLCVCIVS